MSAVAETTLMSKPVGELAGEPGVFRALVDGVSRLVKWGSTQTEWIDLAEGPARWRDQKLLAEFGGRWVEVGRVECVLRQGRETNWSIFRAAPPVAPGSYRGAARARKALLDACAAADSEVAA